MLFVLINAQVDNNARITEFFAITKDEMPTMRIIVLADEMKKYKPESSDMTVETIKQFVQDFKDGKLKVRFNYGMYIFIMIVKLYELRIS